MSDAADTSPTEIDPISAGPRDRPQETPAEGPSDGSAQSPVSGKNRPDRQGEITTDAPDPVESWFGLRRSDRLFVTVLAGVALSLMGVHWLRLSGWGMRPVEIERQQSRTYDYKIDINTAAEAELIQLEGIGPTLAKRIVADRVRNGPFKTIDDLQRVRGIGPRKVETIRKWLTPGPEERAINTPE